MKKKLDEENRSLKNLCENVKCNNVKHSKRHSDYKYCYECLEGIRVLTKPISESKTRHNQLLSECNKKYGTDYYIIYPHWELLDY